MSKDIKNQKNAPNSLTEQTGGVTAQTGGTKRSLRLFDAVKADDVAAFSCLIEEKKTALSLCFGRFPLLSLCYLYKSRKIVKKYESELSCVSSYVYAEESFEMYKTFKSRAKRSLRLYIGESSIVSPAEMLAAIGESEYLKEAYPRLPKTEKTRDNIAIIYKNFHGRAAVQTKDAIAVGGTPLSRFKKICVSIMLIAAALMAVCPFAAWSAAKNALGTGTSGNPIKISNARQLENAFKGGVNYIITGDITLPAEWTGGDFAGSIDGDGHTIFISTYKSPFVQTLTGAIQNVNFVFGQIAAEITQDTSFVVHINDGTIKNVSVKLAANLTERAQGDISAACMVYENNGEITGCVLNATVTFAGDGAGNADFAGFCAVNNGAISDSSVMTGSKFQTDTVDVCGIAAVNTVGAVIKNCESNAQIYQHSGGEGWSPQAAGIVLANSGAVSDCTNNGNITVVSTVSVTGGTDGDGGQILEFYAGGIASVNLATLEKCKNNGDIKAEAQSYYIYAGGVAGFSDVPGTIKNSCSYGKISLECADTGNVYLFGGGIAGFNAGSIVNSYSAAVFDSPNENCFFGGISGAAYGYVWNASPLQIALTTVQTNNYYVARSNVFLGVRFCWIYTGASIAYDLFLDQQFGDTVVSSAAELETKEVYWG